MVSLVFKRRFSMAHRLRFDRTSKCATPHGHNEFVSVTLRAKAGSAHDIHWGTSNYGESFANLKREWHRFVDDALDHAFQLGADDPLIDFFKTHEPDIVPRLLIIKGDPTTEAVAMALFQKLSAILARFHPDFVCTRLELEETPTNTVVITDEDGVERVDLGEWCRRADLSLNDLLRPADWEALC